VLGDISVVGLRDNIGVEVSIIKEISDIEGNTRVLLLCCVADNINIVMVDDLVVMVDDDEKDSVSTDGFTVAV